MQEAGKALLSKPWSLFLCLLLILPQTAICDIPRCNPENMGDNPFCIPLDYNKVRKVVSTIAQMDLAHFSNIDISSLLLVNLENVDQHIPPLIKCGKRQFCDDI